MRPCRSATEKSSSSVLHTLQTCTQMSLPRSNCSIDDFVVKSGPHIHESCDKVVDVRDVRAVDHLFNDGSTDFSLKFAILLKKY